MMIRIDTGTNELLCHIENRVCVFTLNKPDKKNALGDILTPALRETLLKIENDDSIGCVMITGSGDAFCSGGDVSGMGGGTNTKTDAEKIEDLIKKQETLTLRLHELNKITIAALPGAAAGAGLSIALACDLRVASENAFITTAFRNVGLSGDYGGSWFLPRLIGLAKAKELFYTAERVAADELLRLGIFNKVYPKASFREDALAYARSIAMGPSKTLARMNVNLNSSLEQSLKESIALEAKHLIESASGDEAREAIKAFLEKRRPQFFEE